MCDKITLLVYSKGVWHAHKAIVTVCANVYVRVLCVYVRIGMWKHIDLPSKDYHFICA